MMEQRASPFVRGFLFVINIFMKVILNMNGKAKRIQINLCSISLIF